MFCKLPSNEREIETECLKTYFILNKKKKVKKLNGTYQKINSNGNDKSKCFCTYYSTQKNKHFVVKYFEYFM